MNIDLSYVGMEKGQQYETIITTINSNGKKNAAPIGVICKGKDKVMCRIFKGSNTLDNILEQKKFVVNITLDPVLFALSTIGNIPDDFYDNSDMDSSDIDNFDSDSSNNDSFGIDSSDVDNFDINSSNDDSFGIDSFVNLNNVDAYLKCEVINTKEAIKKSDPVRKSEAKVIIANVIDIVLNNKCAKAANRGFYCLIESLVNFTRMDIVDKDKKEYFVDRFIESKRVINKVGSKEDKQAIDMLKKALEDKGYKI